MPVSKELKNILNSSKYLAFMYYKGTACPEVYTDEKSVKQVQQNAEEMIKLGLKHGFSIQQQISDYKDQMEIMEQTMVDSGKKSKKGTPEEGCLDDGEMCLWWLNMFALIRLKAIKNDNMNGLLIHTHKV